MTRGLSNIRALGLATVATLLLVPSVKAAESHRLLKGSAAIDLQPLPAKSFDNNDSTSGSGSSIGMKNSTVVQGFAEIFVGTKCSANWINTQDPTKSTYVTETDSGTNLNGPPNVGFSLENLGAGVAAKTLSFDIISTSPDIGRSLVECNFPVGGGCYKIPSPMPLRNDGLYGENVTVDIKSLVPQGVSADSPIVGLVVMIQGRPRGAYQTSFSNITYGGELMPINSTVRSQPTRNSLITDHR